MKDESARHLHKRQFDRAEEICLANGDVVNPIDVKRAKHEIS